MFQPPTLDECQQALEFTSLSDHEKTCKCYQSQYFDQLTEQLWGNWLNQHKESGQTFRNFMDKHQDDDLYCKQEERRVVYIYLLDNVLMDGQVDTTAQEIQFKDRIGNHPCLKKVIEFLRAFYWGVTVKAMQPSEKQLSDYRNQFKFTNRITSFGKKQFLTSDIINFLKQVKPKDCYCMLALTSFDLYPKEDWNYVFGIANMTHQVGVISHSRFDPNFMNKFYPILSEKEKEELILKRSCKLAAHEIGHLFKFKHCIYYDCLMNGYNSLEEVDGTFIDICPIEIRKLKESIGFDEQERFGKMREFFKGNEECFGKELEFVEKILSKP
ncbi:predicted protein [Naegleria gruberi]|uniref:Predicted protein n=1 Tax=Naegleria gruberi TaxID=5762 RepID=D2VFB1_NAEGR|nr:uncharacterized protein NAEGRDRAFT_67562 [Naegleria gruberi]EFC44337.1 predicted protein [Naegleria gruberi]|eukprot:XP_002677081.1 predicted protein [Naegleria gruberi strain NEG-M]